MNISDFLIWLAGGGCLIAASWVLAQIPWYVALVERAKQWIFFGLSVVFGGGAYAISQYVAVATLDKIAPYFLIVAFVFTAIFINKAYTKLSAVVKSLNIKL
jgi:hypothetical protein